MNSRVLIVDDMKENIDILMYALRDNYSVMAARSGEQAIKLLERKKPDLVLLDVTMPGVDGFEVLRFMKGDKSLTDIPVIFITAEHDPRNEEKGLSMGAVDYIRKPFNTSVVNAKVRNLLAFKKRTDSLENLVEERTLQLAASREVIIMGLSLMSESHDRVTGRHIERIKAYTDVLTKKMLESYPDMLAPGHADLIVLFSPLHDVGKASVPEDVLNKNGSLTWAEMEVMKSHTLTGASILRESGLFFAEKPNSADLDIAIEIAQNHHEKYDGTGYPYEISGADIPLSARIVALPDVYDALRSPRPYREPFSHEEAINIILAGDDRTRPWHFDPFVLETFKKVHPVFDTIYTQLSKSTTMNGTSPGI